MWGKGIATKALAEFQGLREDMSLVVQSESYILGLVCKITERGFTCHRRKT